MVTTSRTAAMVLTFRRPKMATDSIRYLLEVEGFEPSEVYLVVNGEGGLDDTELERGINVIRLHSNTGPAGGMRAGIEHVFGDPGYGWIYLCEDDIGASEIPGPRVARLRDAAAGYEATTGRAVGAVAAYSRLLDRRTGLTRPHVPTDVGGALVRTDVASWGATLLHRRVHDAGILPDKDYFFGYEDFDFWLSMTAAGFDLLLDAEVARALGTSLHPTGREAALGHARTIDDTEPWRRYYEARNFIRLARRHGHVGWTLSHLGKSVRRGSLGKSAHRRAIGRGLLDGIRGRTGPNPEFQRTDEDDEPASRPEGTPNSSLVPPSFLVGCGRSGTTLLRAMLDSHPSIAVPPESYFVAPLLKQRSVFEAESGFRRERFLEELASYPSFDDWGLDPEVVAAFDDFRDAADVATAISAVYASYANAEGKTRSVDKTPFSGQNITLLAASFPQSRFVHLVRDGRNVAQSLADMHFGPGTLESGILEWRRNVDAIDEFAADEPDRILTVRYEDLVADPAATLNQVCDHLGTAFDPLMLSYPDKADELLQNMHRTEHLEGIRSAPTEDPRSWRLLPDRDRRRLERLAHDALERHGYPTDPTTEQSLIDHLELVRAEASFKLRTMRLGLGAKRSRYLRRRRIRAAAQTDRSPSARAAEAA